MKSLLVKCAIFFYIVSAIAFECSKNTAIISTIAIYIMFGCGVLYFIRNPLIRSSSYLFSLIGLVVVAALRTFAANASSTMGYTIVYWMITCNVVCVIVYHYISNDSDGIKVILWGNIVGALILAYRIVGAYGGVQEMIAYASTEGERRIGSILLNANSAGLFMANAAICSMFVLIKTNKKTLRLIMLPFIIIFCFMGLMAGSKKTVVFLVLGILILLLYYSKGLGLYKALLLYVVITAILIGLIYLISVFPAFSTIRTRMMEFWGTLTGMGEVSDSDQARIEFVSQGLRAFLDNPLFGQGTGHSYILFDTYSHNNFIELLLSYGIVGFLVYYYPYIVLVFMLWRRINKMDLIAIYFFAFVLLELVLSVGWVNYYDRVVQIIVASAWGYILSLKKQWGACEYET